LLHLSIVLLQLTVDKQRCMYVNTGLNIAYNSTSKTTLMGFRNYLVIRLMYSG